ncbi:MAG: formimidoylglutamase [Flavobacteriia bacterium]|nr:formimidoylglutamase [Flavobacteriia bacterium]
MIELTDKNIWTGRFDDEDGELGTRWHQKVEIKNFGNLTAANQPNIALLGFCSDEGVRRNKGRTGAKDAPDRIRKSLANLPYNFESKKSIFDFGNIILEDQNLEKARKQQAECVSELIRNNYFPIVLGGGHETAFGDFLGFEPHFENIGIINIDAHFDIRIPVEHSTSGTPFFEMSQHCQTVGKDFNYFVIGIQPTGNTQALFSRAETLGVQTVLADEVHTDLNFGLRKLEDFIQKVDAVYLSLDLDVIDAAFAPGVSAPCVNGLTAFQVKSIIQKVIRSGKLKLFDVVEYNPEYDIDNRTSKLAAHFISEFL